MITSLCPVAFWVLSLSAQPFPPLHTELRMIFPTCYATRADCDAAAAVADASYEIVGHPEARAMCYRATR